MEKTAVVIGILGGIGLGLLLGSEYSSRNITLVGAALLLLFFVSLGIQIYRGKKIEHT